MGRPRGDGRLDVVIFGAGAPLRETIAGALGPGVGTIRVSAEIDGALALALEGPELVIVDGDAVGGGMPALLERISRHPEASVPVVVSSRFTPGLHTDGISYAFVLPSEGISTDLPGVLSLLSTISSLKRSLESGQKDRESSQRMLRELMKISHVFAGKRRLDELLGVILDECRAVACADAGCMYLVDQDRENRRQVLTFEILQNDSMPVDLVERRLPLDSSSIAGHVATSGDALVLSDAYTIGPGAGFRFDPQWDQKTGYRSHSMLVVPMKNHQGEVLGVIQLINRKASREVRLAPGEENQYLVQSFTVDDREVMEAIASLAAVAVENARLVESMTELFEGFVSASARAVETLDSATSGHCERLAQYACHTAEAINRIIEGPLARYKFSPSQLKELRFAGLLHDIGKIGVRESVLKKDRRLTEDRLEIIKMRFEYFKEVLKHKAIRQTMNSIFAAAGGGATSMAQVERDLAQQVARLEDTLAFILEINTYGRLDDPDFERLKEIAAMELVDFEGRRHRYLTEEEFENLAVRRGNLTPGERSEIEEHINLTYDILASIPWLPEYRCVPEIAGAHHERIDGSGYPRGLKGEETHIGGQILAMVDIYEALTASDRPYKPPVPVEKALKILEAEAAANHLNPHVVRLFIDEKIYQKVSAPKPVERKAGSTREAW